MVLSVPCRQVFQEVANRIILWHLLGVDIHLDVSLRIALSNLLAQGSEHDAVQRLLGQRAIGWFSLVSLYLLGEFHFTVEDVATEHVVLRQELLHNQYIFL